MASQKRPSKSKNKSKSAPNKSKPVAKKKSPAKSSPKSKAAKALPKKTSAKSAPAQKVKAKSKPAGKASRSTKGLSRNFLQDLAQAVKDAVLPAIISLKGREIVGTAQSGDATFELDRIAEKALLNFLNNAKMPVAYYSEDAGYTTFTSNQPTHLLVVDPIDGTRAAKNAFEGCVVAVCSTQVIERPTVKDLDNGLVMEIMGNRTFYAERGGGAKMYVNGHSKKIKLSDKTSLDELTWSMTVPARPAELIFPTAAKLIDISSLKGGFFICNSTSFSLTRLLSSQLDACIDIANRYYRDIPDIVVDDFINAGRGNILGLCPYDFAAALLIAQEAGCIVTDAYGKSLDDVLLLDSSHTNYQSIIAAANPKLHKMLLEYFTATIKHVEAVRKKVSAAR
ncbi:MAG: hypothetical protein COA73_17095 [Candidatus Hydrogenedentota bacterium]|nr:MAG: hypothetical protein COA73_17095 [Candidatus Hydrogenedentota bacterium]